VDAVGADRAADFSFGLLTSRVAGRVAVAVVDADGLVETDEVAASRESRGELPILADVGVGEAAGIADAVGAQDGRRDRALEGGEPEEGGESRRPA
jgi:hypothetical protein